MTIKEITEKVKDSKELLLSMGAVIAITIGGFFWLQDTLYEREVAVIEKHSELLSDSLIAKISRRIEPASKRDLRLALDSVINNQARLEKLSLKRDNYIGERQDVMVLAIENQQGRDSIISEEIKQIRSELNDLSGKASLTLEQQRLYAERDSIRDVLMHLENQIKDQMMLDEMKGIRQDDFQEMKKLIKEDDMTKVIRRKSGKARKKKEFKDRILVPL